MGSSARKKKSRKQDFQKPKLKVGKARPKPTNFTDTSFAAKSIVVSKQSLKTDAPSTAAQLDHHISLLSSRSDKQRQESLSFLASATGGQDELLPQPVNMLLPKLLPLALDRSNGVRSLLLKLLRKLPGDHVRGHMEKISLYIRAGMTNLAADLRHTSLEILEWALSISGEQLVSCPGGWIKTLKSVLLALGWHDEESTRGWTASRGLAGRTGTKPLAKTIDLLAAMLRVGLIPPPPPENPPPKQIWFPLWHVDRHMLPTRSNEYGYLNLFGPPRDEEGQMYQSTEEREKIFRKVFGNNVEKGAAAARGEGGEVGRAAAAITKVLEAGLKEEDSGPKWHVPVWV